ncbi:hypothetical protein Tco_0458123 [Tanacetum coccineum]
MRAPHHPPIIHYSIRDQPPKLPIPLPATIYLRRADITTRLTPAQKRLLLTHQPGCELGRVLLLLLRDNQDPLREPDSEILRENDDRLRVGQQEGHLPAVRAEIEQRQAVDDLAVQHIMRTQALEAGARVDTLEDTGSSS